jgi:hypothetical protein
MSLNTRMTYYFGISLECERRLKETNKLTVGDAGSLVEWFRASQHAHSATFTGLYGLCCVFEVIENQPYRTS